MKLFISYSRQDSIIVNQLVDDLRQRHTVWYDQNQISGGQEWWNSILDGIEQHECVLVILSPDYIQSIYCMAELNYAVELGKPIIPLMLRTCPFPAILNERQIQFIDGPGKFRSRHDLYMRELVENLGEMRLAIRDGKYLPVVPAPARPPVPGKKLSSLELIKEAEKALDERNYELAETHYQSVIDNEASGVVQRGVAQNALQGIQQKKEQMQAYKEVKDLIDSGSRSAREGWEAYRRIYDDDYDPDELAARFSTKEPPQPPPLTVSTEMRALTVEELLEQVDRTQDNREKEDILTQILNLNAKGLDATKSDIFYRRGNIYYERGDYDAAIKDFQEALRLNPRDARAKQKLDFARRKKAGR